MSGEIQTRGIYFTASILVPLVTSRRPQTERRCSLFTAWGVDVSASFPGGSTVRSRNHEARVEIPFAEDVSGGSYYVSWSDLYHVRLFQRGFFRPFGLISCPELERHLFLACGPVWFETLRDVTFAIPITPGAEIAMLLFASIEMVRYGMKPVLMRMVKGVTGCSNYRRKSWL
jgi:hypothetical protein